VIHHTLRGVHREHGRPARRSAALATPDIKRLVAACRARSLADLRDRALGSAPVTARGRQSSESWKPARGIFKSGTGGGRDGQVEGMASVVG